MKTIYCLVPRAYWQQWEGKEEYYPRDYEQEGFIHATKGDELLEVVADRVYSQFSGELLVLVVDEEKCTAPIKYEQAKDGLMYPHIYGGLNRAAIVDIRHMERVADHWRLGESFR